MNEHRSVGSKVVPIATNRKGNLGHITAIYKSSDSSTTYMVRHVGETEIYGYSESQLEFVDELFEDDVLSDEGLTD
jgi:hypothetical protein